MEEITKILIDVYEIDYLKIQIFIFFIEWWCLILSFFSFMLILWFLITHKNFDALRHPLMPFGRIVAAPSINEFNGYLEASQF